MGRLGGWLPGQKRQGRHRLAPCSRSPFFDKDLIPQFLRTQKSPLSFNSISSPARKLKKAETSCVHRHTWPRQCSIGESPAGQGQHPHVGWVHSCLIPPTALAGFQAQKSTKLPLLLGGSGTAGHHWAGHSWREQLRLATVSTWGCQEASGARVLSHHFGF